MADKWFEFERTPEGGFILRFNQPKVALMNDETHEHIIAAQKETLKALRSFLDAAVESLEKREAKRKPAGRTRIKVE